MGSRGQSGRDKDARDIVGQYSLEGIGENKAKILSFFRDMDGTDDRDIEDRFRERASTRQIGSQTYTLSDQDRSNIPDFQKYIRSGENFLNIGKRGLPIDSAYEELVEMFPGRFPRSITNPADQLQRINSVLGQLRNSRTVEASDEDKEAAAPFIYDSLARAYNEIRRRKRRRVLNFGDYTSRGSNRSGGGRYSFSDDDELPFF